jgi:DNA-binding MarR family transcriptional regulator
MVQATDPVARALEDRGLVARTEDLDDRGAIRLDLAPAGLAVLDESAARRSRSLAAMLTRFADSLSTAPAPNRSKTETPA